VSGGALLLLGRADTAAAQTGSSANAGALKFSASIDAPSVYVFRGMVQEEEPTISLTPSADVTVAFGSARVHLGTWHALLGGSSGENGPTGRLHYEERFSAGVALPVGGLAVDATYTSYSGPGFFLSPRHEVSVRVDPRRWFGSYALVAVELDGALDELDENEDGKGTYLELGATPDLSLGSERARFGVPVKVGLSLNNYYQAFRTDSRFGFFSVGGLITLPLHGEGTGGAWDLRGGVDLYLLGDAPQARNNGKKEKVVATIGLSLRY
jgi:hypothetical protein